MKNTFMNNIREVEPYVPGEQPENIDVIKLNTNENPYPPAPAVAEVLERVDADRFRLYPDAANTELVNALADFYGLEKEQIFTGVGSDDVLSLCFLTFFNSGKPILFPDITYAFYDVWAELYRIPYVQCPLDEDMRIRRDDYCRENGGIVIPNPNAPTGIYQPLSDFEYILEHNKDVIVIIDEAYVDFSDGPSARTLLERYPNLIVVQTFSKSRAMAGMRIGFAMGSKELIQALNNVKYSFNSYTMSQVALASGAAAVKDADYFYEHVGMICRTREAAKKRLAELGFTFPDSQSNFIFVTHESVPAAYIFDELKKRNIFVRHWNKPRISNSLRITIGTDKQMEALYSALSEILDR